MAPGVYGVGCTDNEMLAGPLPSKGRNAIDVRMQKGAREAKRVTAHRPASKCTVRAVATLLPYHHARWIEGEMDLSKLERPGRSTCLLDVEGRPLALFETDWAMRMTLGDYPDVKFVAAVQPGRTAKAS